MIALGFCSFGGSNNPVCFSYIQHQTEGEKLYNVTFFEMQQAVMAVLKAKTVKDCEFSTCVRDLKCRDHVVTYLESAEFAANQLPIDQAQCDQLPGWACFSRDVFGFPPNICRNHLTGMPTFVLFPNQAFDIFYLRRHCSSQLSSCPSLYRTGCSQKVRSVLQTDPQGKKYSYSFLCRARPGTVGRLHPERAEATGRRRLVLDMVDRRVGKVLPRACWLWRQQQ